VSVSLYTTARGVVAAKRVLDKLSYFDARSLLDNLGAVVENQTRRRIQRQEGPPDGGSWAEYSESYRKEKKRKGKLRKGFLRLYGDLLDTMTHNVIGSDAVEIGSNRPYAATHQLGSKDGSTPARPYLGLTDENEDELEQATVAWIKGVAGI